MKIAYFTPLTPVNSGISDWSEELLPYLKRHVEIDIYVDNIDPDNEDLKKIFSIYDIERYAAHVEDYDLAVFQMGNSPFHNRMMEVFDEFGGILELHDVALHHYWAARTIACGDKKTYEQMMNICHGEKGKRKAQDFFSGKCAPPWVEDSMLFTMNKYYIDRAKAVIVHSDFARQMVKGVAPDKLVYMIPLHTSDIVDEPDEFKQECRYARGIKEETLIFGAFGMVTPYKRIDHILEALYRFMMISNRDFKFYIVGENSLPELDQKVREYGLEGNLVITGRTNLQEFKEYMGACDIAFNLRFPTHGESSASLHRLLGYGKPVIVTAEGSFLDYPDEFIKKVSVGRLENVDILKNICELSSDMGTLKQLSKKIVAYAKSNFDIAENAERYRKCFCDIISGKRDEVDYTEKLTDEIDWFGVDVARLLP